MTIVAQIQNLRSFITTQLPDVIDWNKHVRDDPLKKTTGDIAYVEIVTPFNRYKLAMGSAYADPPSGAPDQCRMLGWVTFQHVGEDKYVLAPKNDLTYRSVCEHIHVRELTDSLSQCRREIAEASDPQVAQVARIRMKELATKGERWGIKANVPEAPESHHVNALPNGEPPKADIRAPSPEDNTTELIPSRIYHTTHEHVPFVGAPIIYYGSDRIAGMDKIPGVLVKIQADGRAAMFLMADLNEITFMDNIHRRGTDAGNGRVHQTNCWDFNPEWLKEQARIRDIERDLEFFKEEYGHLKEWTSGAERRLLGMADELDRRADRLTKLEASIIALEAKPKRGRPPNAAKSQDNDEEPGAEPASELRDE